MQHWKYPRVGFVMMNEHNCSSQTCSLLQIRHLNMLTWWVLCRVSCLNGSRLWVLLDFLFTRLRPSAERIQPITWGWLPASTLGLHPIAVHQHGNASLMLSWSRIWWMLFWKWNNGWRQGIKTTVPKNKCLFLEQWNLSFIFFYILKNCWTCFFFYVCVWFCLPISPLCYCLLLNFICSQIVKLRHAA